MYGQRQARLVLQVAVESGQNDDALQVPQRSSRTLGEQLVVAVARSQPWQRLGHVRVNRELT